MKILTLFLLASCAGSFPHEKPRDGKTIYSYVDAGGTYKLVRDRKHVQQKLITRIQLMDSKASASKVLEKSVLLSQIGSINVKKKRLLIVRPLASEFTVWLEGKRYSSSQRIDEKTKSMKVTLESPEKKWSGSSLIKFPAGKHFCFFNQIPECLYHNRLLDLAKDNSGVSYDFTMIWDSWPYVQDQLTGIGNKLFAPAVVKFDGVNKGLFRYIVEVEGQMILFQFTKSTELAKVAWISQGITIAPPGQAIVDEE